MSEKLVLVIMWGMSTVGDPQGQGSFQSSASGTFGERPCVSHPPYEPRTDMIQGFVPWDSTRDVPQEYAFQPPLAEVAYRHALKESLVEQARLPLKNVKRPNNPSTQPASGKKRVRSIRHKIPSGKEVPNDVPTLRRIDGA
jgi:hypothetical protein